MCEYDTIPRVAYRQDSWADSIATSKDDLSEDKEVVKEEIRSVHSEPTSTPIPQAKKWGLLAMFSMGFFVDNWSYSAFFIFTDPISADLGVEFAQQSWVIVSGSISPSNKTSR